MRLSNPLDPFAGSGTTLLAADRTGRRARLLEIDPRYADVIVRRWQSYSGESARLYSGESFAEINEQRRTTLSEERKKAS